MNQLLRTTLLFFVATLCTLSLFTNAIGANKTPSPTPPPTVSPKESPNAISNIPKVTFVELGSVNCVPCKMMQPVMKNLEKRYPKDLNVIFYDVWTEAGKPAGEKYGIRAIPTQVFLDASGKEISRHEGFFPEAEIEKILKARGVTQ